VPGLSRATGGLWLLSCDCSSLFPKKDQLCWGTSLKFQPHKILEQFLAFSSHMYFIGLELYSSSLLGCWTWATGWTVACCLMLDRWFWTSFLSHFYWGWTINNYHIYHGISGWFAAALPILQAGMEPTFGCVELSNSFAVSLLKEILGSGCSWIEINYTADAAIRPLYSWSNPPTTTALLTIHDSSFA